ncbi:MAG TPA: hypothetical protein VFK80_06515, partial [Limnochordia bacterium]|nr:hypothetical protein [Limnochordia bacterium]
MAYEPLGRRAARARSYFARLRSAVKCADIGRFAVGRLVVLCLSASLVAGMAESGARAAASLNPAGADGLYAAISRNPARSDPDKADFVAQLMVRREGGSRAAAAINAFTAVWAAEPGLVAGLAAGDLGRVLDRLQAARTPAAAAADAAHRA